MYVASSFRTLSLYCLSLLYIFLTFSPFNPPFRGSIFVLLKIFLFSSYQFLIDRPASQIPANLEFKFVCLAERIQGRAEWPIFQEHADHDTAKFIFRVPYWNLRQNDRVRVNCSVIRRLHADDPDELLFVAYTVVRL